MHSSSRESTVTVMNADISIETEHGTCAAHLALPEGAGKYPALVLIEEVWGVDKHIKDVAGRLAREGFIVLAPELLPEGTLEVMTPQVKIDLFDPEKREKVQPILREAMAPISQPEFAKDTI